MLDASKLNPEREDGRDFLLNIEHDYGYLCLPPVSIELSLREPWQSVPQVSVQMLLCVSVGCRKPAWPFWIINEQQVPNQRLNGGGRRRLQWSHAVHHESAQKQEVHVWFLLLVCQNNTGKLSWSNPHDSAFCSPAFICLYGPSVCSDRDQMFSDGEIKSGVICLTSSSKIPGRH